MVTDLPSVPPGGIISFISWYQEWPHGVCRSPNIPAMYELHFSVPMSGAILNTINTRLDARTIFLILQRSESKLVFVDHLLSSLILEAISLFPSNAETPRLVLMITDDDTSSATVGFIDTYENMVEKLNLLIIRSMSLLPVLRHQPRSSSELSQRVL